jgi:hypothetical protein
MPQGAGMTFPDVTPLPNSWDGPAVVTRLETASIGLGGVLSSEGSDLPETESWPKGNNDFAQKADSDRAPRLPFDQNHSPGRPRSGDRAFTFRESVECSMVGRSRGQAPGPLLSQVRLSQRATIPDSCFS